MSFESLTGGARWPARSLSALAFVLALAIGIAALCPGRATAGVVTQPEHVSVSVRGLSVAERRALAITSVSAVGDQSLGLFVTVAFKGEVERYLGQGRLASALLGLVLVPTSSSRQQSAIGLVDLGGGYVRVPIPILKRSGDRIALKRGAASVFTPERALPTSGLGPVEVFRAGNQVIFYLANPGLTSVGEVKLKDFAASPIPSGKGAAGIRDLTGGGWRAVVNEKPAGLGTVAIDASMLTGDQLQTVQTQLLGVRSTQMEPELRQEKQARAELQADVRDYSTLALASSRRVPRVSRAALVRDLSNVTLRVGHLQREITQLSNLAKKVLALSEATRPDPAVEVTQTDPGLSEEMAAEAPLAISTIQPQGVPIIDVNDGVRHQQFAGLGAALTDSSAWLIGNEISPASRQSLMQALFGSPGLQNGLGVPSIHLNFLRVAMGASGAMTVGAPYSYDDMPSGQTDPSLTNFSIGHDLAYIIPTLQQARSINPGLQILANPWSPPAWMKSNDSLDNPDGQGTLLSSDYQSLADYFVKFIQAYQANGVPIDAITPQNEPSSGQVSTPYPGMTLTEPDEERFIAQYLEPALKAAGLDTKIYGNDLSWDSTSYADDLATGAAAGDLAGIAWHCYFGSALAMSQLQQLAPGLDQIVDECSPEIRPVGTPEFLISSLRDWASLASVWTVALDPSGGPIQPGNDCPGCTGPVTINEQNQTVTFRPEYYQLGQVSAFVQPGAWRIDSSSSVTYGVSSLGFETASSGLDDVAFLNPDGSKVLIAENNSSAPITFAVDCDGSYFTYTLPAWAMTTFVWS